MGGQRHGEQRPKFFATDLSALIGMNSVSNKMQGKEPRDGDKDDSRKPSPKPLPNATKGNRSEVRRPQSLHVPMIQRGCGSRCDNRSNKAPKTCSPKIAQWRQSAFFHLRARTGGNWTVPAAAAWLICEVCAGFNVLPPSFENMKQR